MMKAAPASAAAIVLLLCNMALMTVHAQQCKTFTRFETLGASGAIMDAIDVPDDTDGFVVGSMSVSGIGIVHPSIGSLQVTLLHRAPNATSNTAVVLKGPNAGSTGADLVSTSFADNAGSEFPAGAEAAPFTGSWKPAQALSGFAGQRAAGTWVLRVADLSKDAGKRTITLTGWTLSICPGAAVAAAAGPSGDQAGPPALPSPGPMPAVNVSLNSSGLTVNVSGTNNTFRLGVGNGKVDVSGYSGAGDIMNLMFPFKGNDTQPGPVASAVLTAKDAARSAVSGHIGDSILFAQKQSSIIKDLINAKLSRFINNINAGSAATQNLLKSGGSDLRSTAQNMRTNLLSLQGAVQRHQGLKTAVKQDLQNKIQHCLDLLSQFISANTAVVGNMGSTLTMVKDAAMVKAKAAMDTYQTAEGIAKSHVDNIITTHTSILDAKLDKIIKVLDAASTVTGPVLDAKINLDKAALMKLSSALDTVAAAAKAMPAPSKALQAKASALASLLGNTRIGSTVTDPEKALSNLMGKISQAQSLIKGKLAG